MKQMRIYILLFLFFFLLVFGNDVISYSRTALLMWFEKLIPSLFVMMIFVQVLFHCNAMTLLAKPFGFGLNRILHISSSAFTYVVACMLLGFPAGSQFIKQAYEQKELSLSSTKRLLYTCSFAAPGFVIFTCGGILLRSIFLGVVLYVIQLCSGLCLLFFTRKQSITETVALQMSSASMLVIWKRSLQQAGITLFYIGGYLMIFSTISSIISKFLPTFLQIPLQILSEFSSGTMLLYDLLPSFPSFFVGLSMLLSFGGFCVHMQVFGILEDFPLIYYRYLSYRILQAVLAAFLASLFLYFYLS